MNTHILGIEGEEQAKVYLLDKKYKILAQNYKNKIGEIDLICKKDDTYVFVEVKARNTKKFGMPREAVNPYKQHKIRLVAEVYIKQHNLYNQ